MKPTRRAGADSRFARARGPVCDHGSPKSAGQVAYEADVEARPNYRDGTPRKTWDALGDVEKWSWGRPPLTTPGS